MYPIYRKRIEDLKDNTYRAVIEQKDARRAPWTIIDGGQRTTHEDAKLDAKNLFAMYGDGEGHA